MSGPGTNDTMATMTDDAVETKVRRPATRGWGLGERMGDAGLTLIIAVLSLRLMLAVAMRGDGALRVGVEAREAAQMSAAVLVAIVMLGAWAVVIAPAFAALLLQPARSASASRQFSAVMLTAALTVAIPLVYVALAHTAFSAVPDSLRTAAWGLTGVAIAMPGAVFVAGKALARAWLARVIVLLIALASVFHLVFWIAAR